ncbi:glycosyltransferase family 2 protein [Antarcticibacterium arcticum]|uniref:Glycosyltransferase family 2 protein n=1 Tax=Antarcticibacterium arcticum TaxID=2585771 RepID=A0A5B8YJ00_9FLAO|nr:glycosyltransferase family 2 protein [Antarcticibacterium arcticum]QED37754.1 glycosyltransferase family 2 protein [Antarcticibacterium arcticum]
MEASILIVSRNRKRELEKTLGILECYINKDCHEIRVFLDGCSDGSEELEKQFPSVYWYNSKMVLGASVARSILYEKAIGKFLFGFDDDAHPLQRDFIKMTSDLFKKNKNLGIISFREIKGVFKNDEEIPEDMLTEREDYFSNEFLGCGFAMKKQVYDKTRGFPVWIDIYGEEVCLAWETLIKGYSIMISNHIMVNHRVDQQKRKTSGAGYFRFGKQLKNTTFFYLVYYPFPLLIKKILRLWYHNFSKYALRDRKFLKEYFLALGQTAGNFKRILKFRRPVTKKELLKIKTLKNPGY